MLESVSDKKAFEISVRDVVLKGQQPLNGGGPFKTTSLTLLHLNLYM